MAGLSFVFSVVKQFERASQIVVPRSFLPILALILSIACIASFSACSKGKAATDEKKDLPKATITLDEVDQRKVMDKRVSDGQFVILHLHLENPSNQVATIPSKEILLETATEDKSQYYTLSPETSLGQAFRKIYGAAKGARLITTNDVGLNPKMTADRYLIFVLPENAALADYDLNIKTYDLKLPLSSQSTVVNDFRAQDPSSDFQNAQP